MKLSRRYSVLAYSLLKSYLKFVLPSFVHLKKTLESAYFSMPLEEYIAAMLLTIIILVPSSTLFGIIVGTYSGYNTIGILIMSIISGLVVSALVLLFFEAYPQYKLNTIKTEIDKYLPYAVTHMATIAGTGVPPQAIFKMLGSFKEYKMVSYICERISRNVSIFGYDILTAISEEAQRVSSYKFRDILWTISSTIRSGGDLRSVLIEKSRSLMEDQRRIEAKYIEFLSMMAEMYATIFVAGTIIIYVMVSIIGVIGGLPIPVKQVLQLFTYLLIPVASIGFIIMLDSTKPTGA